MTFDKFNLKTLSSFFNMAIIGRTETGKTTFLKHMLNSIDNITLVFLIIGNADSYTNNEYLKYVYPNHTFILDGNKEVNKIILTKTLDSIKKFSSEFKILNPESRTIVIFDDVSKKLRDNLNGFAGLCRHSNISTIFLVQSYKNLDVETRDNLGYVVLTSNSNIDVIFERSDLNNNRLEVDNFFKDRTDIKNSYVIYDINTQKLYYYTLSNDELLEVYNNIFVVSTLGSLQDTVKEIILQNIPISDV